MIKQRLTIIPPEVFKKSNASIEPHGNNSAHNDDADDIACRDHMCSANSMMDMRHFTWRWSTGRNLGQRYTRFKQGQDLIDLVLTCHVGWI
jgi:hypothetical protein